MSRKILAKKGFLNVAQTISCTVSEGPGKRFALWVQGCPMRCKDCCNQEMLPFVDKDWVSVDDVLAKILRAKEKRGIEGVTFLGGEPFSQAESLAILAKKVREHGLTVMVFSGFTVDTLKKGKMPGALDFLEQIDLLVDGQFEADNLEDSRRWIGSANQQTIDLSGAYAELVSDWDTSSNTLEMHIQGGKVIYVGSPFLMKKKGYKA